MEKWIEEERDMSEDDTDTITATSSEQQSKPWLPQSLALLFGRQAWQPLEHPKWWQFDEEAQMMELLATEYEEEPPNDGELEGSGDDYA